MIMEKILTLDKLNSSMSYNTDGHVVNHNESTTYPL